MDYVTFAEVRSAVHGPALFKALLEGHAEDMTAAGIADDDGANAADHPFFDKKLETVQRSVDSILARAGYTTPLTSITDPALQLAIIQLVVDLLTQARSNREPWVDSFAQAGHDYFDAVAAGDIVVDGAVLAVDPTDAASGIQSRRVDQDVWDVIGDLSEIDGLFPPLGNIR